MSKFSIQFVLFEQFLKEHKLTYESLRSLLAEHFDREVLIDSQEDILVGRNNSAAATEYEEVEAEELIVAKGSSPILKRASSSASSSFCHPIKLVPKEVDSVVVVPQTDVTPPSRPPSLPSSLGAYPPNPKTPSWTEIETSITQRKARGRPPRIQRSHRKHDTEDRVMERDLDRLIRSYSTRSFSDWQEAILASTPENIAFTIFGFDHGGGSESSQSHTAPEPHCIATSPVPEVSEALPTHRSIWDDHNAPPEVEDDRPPGGVATNRPRELFAVRPGLPSADAAATIAVMRDLSYYSPAHDAPGGYAWATGAKPGSAGFRVRQRFRNDGHCRSPTVPPLEEITCFTKKRSLPTPTAVDESDASAFAIMSAFPYGSLFKIEIAKHPRYSERCWHGTNLYCAHSLFMHGPRNNIPANGPTGVYCFTDLRLQKVPFYCVYTLSGSGRAWTVFVELAVPDDKYKRVSKDQRCAQARDITMTAIWFHGVEHPEFSAEYIWPTWNPDLEVHEAL